MSLVVVLSTPKVETKPTKIETNTYSPVSPAMKTMMTRSAKVISNMYGQILSRTVMTSGSGSALSAGLMIRKDRAAPQESDSTEVTKENS